MDGSVLTLARHTGLFVAEGEGFIAVGVSVIEGLGVIFTIGLGVRESTGDTDGDTVGANAVVDTGSGEVALVAIIEIVGLATDMVVRNVGFVILVGCDVEPTWAEQLARNKKAKNNNITLTR